MLEINAKLSDLLPVVPYFKRDEQGQVINNEMGEPVVAGHMRQVVFTSMGVRPDVLVFRLFHDEARGFDLPIGTPGRLRFTIRSHSRQNNEYIDLSLIDFEPQYC